MPLEENELYASLREDIRSSFTRIWKTRAWGVALAAATGGLCVQVLALDTLTASLTLAQRFVVCSGIVSVGATLNAAFWWVSLVERKGMVHLGTYCWYLEQTGGLRSGWESWTLFREGSQKRGAWQEIGLDVQAWLAGAYFVATLVLLAVSPGRVTVIAVVLAGSFLVCLVAHTHSFSVNYRQAAVKELLSDLEMVEDWPRLEEADRET